MVLMLEHQLGVQYCFILQGVRPFLVDHHQENVGKTQKTSKLGLILNQLVLPKQNTTIEMNQPPQPHPVV